MAQKIWSIATFCGLVCLALACSRLDNRVRSHALECGGDTAYNPEQKIYKIFLDGSPVAAAEVAKLSLNGSDIAERISTKGCFVLEPQDKGVVAVAHKDGRHAMVWDSSKDASGGLRALNLEFLKPINLDPKDKDIIFRDFCSEPSRTLYLPKPQLSFFLNFSPMGRPSIMNTISHVYGVEQTKSADLISTTRLVEPVVEAFTISLPETNATTQNQVEIDVIDVFGNKVTSNKCEVIVDQKAPRLLSIAKSPYFQNMFVRSASADSIEFSITAGTPVRKFEIEYIDSKSGSKDRIETYVPFNEKDGYWKVLAPLPSLSGVKNLSITIESSSGLRVHESAVINFGEKRYVDGGVKFAKTSQNEEFMVMASYFGLVKVLELKSDKVIFEKHFDDNVNSVDITNDGRKAVIGLSAVDLIIETREGKSVEFKQQFGKFGFRLDRDQKTVIGTPDNTRFAWIDLTSGEVLRSNKFEKSTIKSWRVSQDNTVAVFAADTRKLYLKNLVDGSSETEIDPPCGNSLISLIEISKSSEYAVFGCDAKVYRQNLKDFTAKPELILEFNTNVWSIAISPDDGWVAAGSMSGEWYVLNDQTKKLYPASELDSLRKGFKFETTVNALAFSADSKFLVAGTENGAAKVFSIEDGDFVESIKAGGQILAAGFINPMNKVFIGSIDGILRRQSIHSPLFAFDLGQRVETLAVAKDFLAIGTSPNANDLSESAAGSTIFSLKNRELLGKITNSKRVNSISFDPEGTRVLTASEDGTAKITSIADLANPLSIGASHRKPGRPVRVAAFSPDGSGMTIVSSKKALAYRLQEYENPFVTMEGLEWVSAAHFSIDNKYISTAAADRMARIYDAADGRVVGSYTAKNWIWDADLTPDLSKFVNLNWDNELVIQTTERDGNGNIIGLKDTSKVGLPNGGEFMALSPNSNWAAVSLWNGQAFMVNLKEGFSYEMKCLPATQALKPLFSSDSRFVAFGQGNAAMVYQVSDGRPVQRAYHADRVTSVAFHEGRLVSGSWDGKVRVTEIDDRAVVDCTNQ